MVEDEVAVAVGAEVAVVNNAGDAAAVDVVLAEASEVDLDLDNRHAVEHLVVVVPFEWFQEADHARHTVVVFQAGLRHIP